MTSMALYCSFYMLSQKTMKNIDCTSESIHKSIHQKLDSLVTPQKKFSYKCDQKAKTKIKLKGNIHNQNGQSVFFALFILILITILALFFISKRIDRISLLKDKQKLLLCSKKYNGELNYFYKNIERTNKVIASVTLAAKIGKIFRIPLLNIIIHGGKKAVLSALKAHQGLLLTSFLKNNLQIVRQGCLFKNIHAINPYKMRAIFIFKRDSLNRTIIKRKKWTQKIFSQHFSIISNYKLPILKISSKIREENLLLKFL